MIKLSFDCNTALVRTSWGTTSKTWVLRSIAVSLSMQGRMKCRPGALAPPYLIRPIRNITALSYSCTIYTFCYGIYDKYYSTTTLKQTHRENGRVIRTKNQDDITRSHPHSPIPGGAVWVGDDPERQSSNIIYL